MAYQTVTKTSYGTRLKNSFGGIFTGFLLFIAGTALLFWNEGRTVKTTRMLKEAQGQCVELGDIAAVNADMNGKVVHASGLATTEERLADDTFGIGAVAIQIAREVELSGIREEGKIVSLARQRLVHQLPRRQNI